MNRRIVALRIAALLLSAGCLPTPAAEETPALPPVRIAVVIDRLDDGSGPQPEALAPLVDLARERGGEIAIGVVSSVERPLARLRLEAPSEPPRTGNRIADRHERARFEATAQAVDEETRQKLSAFGAEVEAALRLPLDGETPWKLVQEAAVFLGEPGEGTRWLIYVGDRVESPGCVDVYGAPVVEPGFTFTDEAGVTYRCCPSGVWMRDDAVGASCAATGDAARLPFPSGWALGDARVLTVRRAPGAGPLDDFGAIRFASLEAAIDYVLEEEGP